MQRALQVLKSSCLTPAMHSDLFYFPLLLQFSSSLSSFGLITSTRSCKWKMLPVNCSIHSHFVLHCWRQGARLFFPVSMGIRAPSGHEPSRRNQWPSSHRTPHLHVHPPFAAPPALILRWGTLKPKLPPGNLITHKRTPWISQWRNSSPSRAKTSLGSHHKS